MSIIDRIRALFGGKPSGAESTAVVGGAVVASSADDRPADTGPQSGSGDSGGSSGDSGAAGSGDAGGAGA
jgi:hypothetical protein